MGYCAPEPDREKAGCGVLTDQAGMIEVNVVDKIAEGAAR